MLTPHFLFPAFRRMDEEHVPAAKNPGSRPVLRIAQMLEALKNTIVNGDLLNPMSPVEPGLFSAQCKHGVLWTNVVEHDGFFTTGVFPGKNLHGGESSLYYLSTRHNAQLRLSAFMRKYA